MEACTAANPCMQDGSDDGLTTRISQQPCLLTTEAAHWHPTQLHLCNHCFH
jgi:hypothetical protein